MIRTTRGNILIVDWAWPNIGAAWTDLVGLLVTVAAAGVDPEPIVAEHRLTRRVDPTAINAMLAGLAGYWTVQSRKPFNSRSPYLRRYQAHAAAISRGWLARRLNSTTTTATNP